MSPTIDGIFEKYELKCHILHEYIAVEIVAKCRVFHGGARN